MPLQKISLDFTFPIDFSILLLPIKQISLWFYLYNRFLSMIIESTKRSFNWYTPSNPAFSSIFIGYQTIGRFPISRAAFGHFDVSSAKRLPGPAAIIMGWNSMSDNKKKWPTIKSKGQRTSLKSALFCLSLPGKKNHIRYNWAYVLFCHLKRRPLHQSIVSFYKKKNICHTRDIINVLYVSGHMPVQWWHAASFLNQSHNRLKLAYTYLQYKQIDYGI